MNDIREILNLRTNDSIGAELAQRQLDVIEKSYLHLSRPGNDVIYIADEVGLGKTYIAAGIALLFRHFSSDPATHREVIIVPKKNLQEKWQKELRNFVKYNFLVDHPLIREQYHQENAIKERLMPLRQEDPVSILKMSSFSHLATPRRERRELYDLLRNHIFENLPLAVETLDIAYENKYFLLEQQNKLRKLVAYLLNALSPKINCLIVDEAHNYKSGIGAEDDDGTLRNELTARFLGAQKDTQLLKDFPALRQALKFPLAEKVICLSATPKDRSLMEIRNQLNCFKDQHILTDTLNTEQLKAQLPRFLIRGNLEYRINDEIVSRNQCRWEHRKGNANKSDTPMPLQLEDSFESIFWQLLQYKSLKHLDQKNGASFEIGMLAGFESYQLDTQKQVSDNDTDKDKDKEKKEYEQVAHRDRNTSQDAHVIKDLVHSYTERFNHDLPPHPKQSKLENEIVEQLGRPEKSLIFVRRVATAYELERRLISRYERDVVYEKQLKLGGRFTRYHSEALSNLLEEFNEKHIAEKKFELFAALLKRTEIAKCGRDLLEDNVEHLPLFLRFTYENKKNEAFRKAIGAFITSKKKNISQELKDATIKALSDNAENFIAHLQEILQDDTTEEIEEEKSSYFFSEYFKPGGSGHRFKKNLSGKTYFELDFPLLFSRINTHSTFLTNLLNRCCREEISVWMDKRAATGATHEDCEVLNLILKSVFRNGAGLLPAFVAHAADATRFEEGLTDLLEKPDAPFHFLLQEIKTIITDFDLLIAINFQDKDKKKIQLALQHLVPVIGTSGQDKKDRGAIATRFRMPGYPYVLVTTDIFREGEDLHTYCQNIYHYGIAWNPSDMEQRTGRIDRINSMSYRKLHKRKELSFDNSVHVFYPYLAQSVEVNQVANLLKNVNRFILTFNDIDKVNHYNSAVSINERIEESDIPKAIKERLKSLYDVGSFRS